MELLWLWLGSAGSSETYRQQRGETCIACCGDDTLHRVSYLESAEEMHGGHINNNLSAMQARDSCVTTKQEAEFCVDGCIV